MYVVYCQNKPKSEFIVAEYDTYFDVSDVLTLYVIVLVVVFCFLILLNNKNLKLNCDKLMKKKHADAVGVCLPVNPAGHSVQVDPQ